MAGEEKKDEKKIIVDEDWKEEAKKEKEALIEQEKKNEAEKQAKKEPLPPGNFAALVSMLTTQALFSLGLLQVEGQEDNKTDLNVAKYNIDMLETLEEKTKGNLTEEEEIVLNNTLTQLRMSYVKAAK